MDTLTIVRQRLSTGREIAVVPGFRDFMVGPDDWEARAASRFESTVSQMKKLMDRLAEHGLAKGACRVLEIGRGSGADTRMLAAFLGRPIHSIDITAPSYELAGLPEEYARYKVVHDLLDDYEYQGAIFPALSDHSQARLYQMSAEELAFEAGSFDLVFCKAVLRSVRSPQKAVHEFFRVLRPGGLFYCEDEPYAGICGLLRRSISDIPWAHLYLSDDELREALREQTKARKRTIRNRQTLNARNPEDVIADARGRGALVYREDTRVDFPSSFIQQVVGIVPELRRYDPQLLATRHTELIFRKD